jgi:hypothetical protein
MQTPPSESRVHAATPDRVNERIRRETEERVGRLAREGPAAIDRRLAELAREWDIERTLMANAATVALIGLALGALTTPWLYLLPALVAAFLLQHAIQGWCPPLPLFRALGRRTAGEIAAERFALKALRGDFEDVHPPAASAEPTEALVARTMDRVRG